MLRVAAPYWKSMGISAEILSMGSSPGQYAPVLESAGYRIHHLPFSRSLSFFRAFRKHLRLNGYDAVHLHTERANFWLALTAWLAGVPRLVRTVHSAFAFKGWLGLKRGIQRRFLRFLGVVHVSIGLSVEETERSYLRNPTVRIFNWYDSEKFLPPTDEQRRELRRNIGAGVDTFVIVSVGNCSPIKNHAAILEALGHLSGKTEFLYLHVGEEEPGEPERKMAERLGIAERVRFLGFVRNVWPLLGAADAYVMPSLWEGLGLSAVEALAVGVPAVLADVPGLRDLDGSSEAISWTKPEPESIRAALLPLAESPKASRKLPVRNIVPDRYGIERGCRTYAALYAGLMPQGYPK